jgi:uncharacterized membrane protein
MRIRRGLQVVAVAGAVLLVAGLAAAAPAAKPVEPPSYVMVESIAAIMCAVVLILPCKRFRRG